MWKNSDPTESVNSVFIIVVKKFQDGGLLFIDLFRVENGRVGNLTLENTTNPGWPTNWWWTTTP